MVTTEAPTAPAPARVPTRPDTVQLRARRSPRLVAIGVLLAVLGGLGAGAAWSQASHATTVVVAARAVPRGQVITASDLTTATVGSLPGISTIPGDQLANLIGQQALVELPAGAMVARGSIGAPQTKAGTAQLGLRVTAGRLPTHPIPVGATVLLVPVPTTGNQAPVTDKPIEATVVSAPEAMSDGVSWVLDVEVPESQAVVVARLAAAEQVVVVRKAGP